MKTINKQYSLNSNTTITLELPVECPHCGTICDPIIKYSATHGNVRFIVLTANCCKKPFYVLNQKLNTDYKYISIYPAPALATKVFDELIEQISPNFVKSYNEAFSAEQLGFITLAGTGYRNAMEILIKDFAINYLKEDSSRVAKLPLLKAIEEFYPAPKTKDLAHFVRMLGNDYTHYETKYDNITFPQFKTYLDGMLYFIQFHLLSSSNPLASKDTSS